MQKLLILSVALVALAGCKSQCRKLSEKLCDCTVNSSDKTACLSTVSSNESRFPPTPSDEAVCAKLFDSCDCRLVETPRGKANCGLARPLAVPTALDGGTD